MQPMIRNEKRFIQERAWKVADYAAPGNPQTPPLIQLFEEAAIEDIDELSPKGRQIYIGAIYTTLSAMQAPYTAELRAALSHIERHAKSAA